MQVNDALKVSENPKFLDLMTNTENVLFSGELIKINKLNSKQKRNIAITTEHIYNIKNDNLLTSGLNLFGLGSLLKRKIDITKVKSIVYARLGNEFVIHVPDEFDYRFTHPQKDIIIMY